jgi:chromosome segregation ATPase
MRDETRSEIIAQLDRLTVLLREAQNALSQEPDLVYADLAVARAAIADHAARRAAIMKRIDRLQDTFESIRDAVQRGHRQPYLRH